MKGMTHGVLEYFSESLQRHFLFTLQPFAIKVLFLRAPSPPLDLQCGLALLFESPFEQRRVVWRSDCRYQVEKTEADEEHGEDAEEPFPRSLAKVSGLGGCPRRHGGVVDDTWAMAKDRKDRSFMLKQVPSDAITPKRVD